MRSDMFKVIVERPRRGGSHDRAVRPRRIDVEDGGPAHESLRRRHADRKMLNENLRPLERFFERSVGRHWDRVYADLSEHLRSSSTVQQHVRDHVGDFVAVRTVRVDGQMLDCSPRFWRGGPRPLAESFCRFYVHPVSNVLRVNRQRKTWKQSDRDARARAAREVLARRRDLTPLRQLHRLDGIWYEIVLAQTVTGTPPPRDVVVDRAWPALDPVALYGRAGVYAVAKRQLGGAELRRHGLRV